MLALLAFIGASPVWGPVLAGAQDGPGAEGCLINCEQTAYLVTACDAYTDAFCVCTSNDFITAVTTCFSNECSQKDATSALTLLSQQCDGYLASSLSLPPATQTGTTTSGTNQPSTAVTESTTSGAPSTSSGAVSDSDTISRSTTSKPISSTNPLSASSRSSTTTATVTVGTGASTATASTSAALRVVCPRFAMGSSTAAGVMFGAAGIMGIVFYYLV